MARPFLLAQLSDPHIGADWDGSDPVPGLKAVVEAVGAHEPDAVLVSGDLTDHATGEEYATVRELLAPLGDAVHVLPGNHDERAALRAAFGLPGAGAGAVNYVAELGPLRLVAVDTTIPGEDSGELPGETLSWLDDALAGARDVPTVVALHHPPLLTGVPAMDELALSAAGREGLAAVLERHPQVQRVVGGHVHRTLTGRVGGRSILAAPSTYRQLRLDFAMHTLDLSGERPGFAIHALLDGELSSHVQHVRAD